MATPHTSFGGHSMVTRLRLVAIKTPEAAFRSQDIIENQWEALGYARAPRFDAARREHQQLIALLENAGAEVVELPPDPRTTIDSIYVHDPVLVTGSGAVVLRMGKPARQPECVALADALAGWSVPILGTLDAPGTGEAGDMVWLDDTTLLVGQGFRTNAEGIRQLQAILKPLHVDVVPVHLPYGNGPGEVLHLMSLISLIDIDLAVVYRRLLPVPLFELLEARGIGLVDVPEEEYLRQASNVLALAPRELVMIGGNPVTRGRLAAAGCRVAEIDGEEICFPGAGGPTCLTRPLRRE